MRTAEIIEELRGRKCRCGQPKGRGKTFCANCYFALTKEHRNALYARLGSGYREAYEAACAALDARAQSPQPKTNDEPERPLGPPDLICKRPSSKKEP